MVFTRKYTKAFDLSKKCFFVGKGKSECYPLSNRLRCQPVLLIVLGASRMILTEGEGVQNLSYLSWDGTGDEKGNTPAADSDKLVTGNRNRNIDPREQGKFDSGVVSTRVMCQKKCCQKCVRKCCQEKENSPLLVEGGLYKEFQTRWKGVRRKSVIKTQMDMTVTV